MTRPTQQAKRQIADSLEQYFSKRLLEPLAEREKEAQTNKAFFLGKKEFEYVKTLTGDEPVNEFNNET